jgi:hypothetical protein
VFQSTRPPRASAFQIGSPFSFALPFHEDRLFKVPLSIVNNKDATLLVYNWAARPLTDYETVLKFIRTTKTSAGLKIRAAFHTKQYQKGIRICDKQMSEVNLNYYTQRPNWNYSIRPSKNEN